ncbi:MAG: PAS domain-containing protein [Nitrospirae bacterium]|nr:PAS domain-containing protein [Nitrospirota bacterium]
MSLKDEDKPKDLLVRELQEMRRRIAELESSATSDTPAEKGLHADDNLYKVLAELAQDLIFIIDRDRYMRYVNGYAARYFLSTPEKIIGRHLQDLFPAAAYERQNAFLQKVFESGEPFFVEDGFSFPDRGVWLDTSLTPISRKDGEVDLVLGIARDITEKKQAEEELRKSHRLESLGILAGGIAHDFNNILTAITGNITLAKMYAKPESEVFEILDEAEKASLRAEDLTRQLLVFSKGGMLLKKIVSLRELLTDLSHFVSQDPLIRCELKLPDDLWPVEADEQQMRKAIYNIIINAKQAMPGGGTIRICAENLGPAGNTHPSLKKGEYIKVSLEDQGTGIEKADLEKIFDPFFSTKEKGSGLGLTSSFSIIRSHDGRITVESKPGKGTVFQIYLPAAQDKTFAPAAEKKSYLPGSRRVLVMDDEEMVRTVVDRMMTQCGCEAVFAKDGDEMLALYRESKEADRPFDAVILDLVIPEGMGGKEAIKRLLRIDPQAKAIVSSGYSDDLMMSDYKKYGFRGVLAKPYKISELGQVLYDVIMDTGQ